MPTVAALNMTDVLKKRGDKLDYDRLGELLGIRAVPVSAAENTGIDELLAACENALREKISSPRYDFLPDGAKLIAELISPVCKEKNIPIGLGTLRLMRGDISACDLLSQREAHAVENLISSNETENFDRELLTVSHIYRFTDGVCKKALRKSKRSGKNFSRRADKILLNRFAAVPLFLAAVLTVFYLTFGSLGTRLGELADSFINGTLADALMRLLGSLGASEWVKDLVCGGILAGLGSVCSFLPQIALLFFFLGLLEDCGYMARGAFIADYPLRLLGLGGKSFVPLFMGFGCSVPALMSTRTLHAGREKKICAAVIPFMSCSAKMPVYAMLISAFFPNVRWVAVILIYSLGIACACAPEAGHMQGEMIGNYVVEHFDEMDLNGDGKISYAMFMGQLGNAEAIYRTQFAVEDADKIITEAGKPALEYFDASNSDKYQVDQDGNWSATAANNYMTTNLSQYNEGSNNMIELVICNNDGMAEGAVSALNDKGYNLGTGKDGKMIPVFGVDATDAAKQLIGDGKMTATVKQDADGMAACIADLAKNAADGKDLMDGTDSYNISDKVSNKIFIPYQEYSGK